MAGAILLLAFQAAPAPASSNTDIGSFADPRADLPSRPGQLVRALYGPFTVPANGQIHNVPLTVAAPCTNCRITDMVPNLVFDGTGATANMNSGLLLHHFVLFNPGQTGLGCPIAEPFFGAGNERTHTHLPTPFGYTNNSANWNLITHLVNRSGTARTVNVEVIYRHRPASQTLDARPLWLDIDSICNGGNSEYTIPTGYSDTHVNWTVPVDGRIIGMSGHLHDIDIIDPTSCSVHCSSKGEAIALTAELVGGSASQYFGPVPPNNPPPADITGATLCRSQAYHGTSFGAGNGSNGHLDTDSHCGIFTDLPAGSQAQAYPAGGAYPTAGIPVQANQVIRLHSEYQNDSGLTKTDVMGIMGAWIAQATPYARPQGAAPMRLSLVPAYAQCTSGNLVHGAALDEPSCGPPVRSSTQLTIGTPDANGAPAKSSGYVRVNAIPGNVNTTPDEADARFEVWINDVRRTTSGLPDYTGQLQLEATIRITDRDNGPAESGVVQDTPFRVTVPCTGTPGDATVGSTCAVNTTADAVLGAGAIKEGKRSIWQLGQVKVNDGGSDGVASTLPNAPFAVQGVMVP